MSDTDKRSMAGKVAVVTGADSGIGRAIAEEFGARGASVLVNYHSNAAAAETVRQNVEKAGGKALVYQADVADPAQVRAMFEAVVSGLGTPYVLVNNAGVNGSGATIDEMEPDVFDRTLKINLYGPFYNCREFIRLRKAAGGQGRIVNISSVHEYLARAGEAEYTASKGGLKMLMKSLALELAPHGITINNVAPGMILTPMNQKAIDDPALRARDAAAIPLQRPGEPWEIAKLVAFLASDDAAYATGQTFTVDGGLSLALGQGA